MRNLRDVSLGLSSGIFFLLITTETLIYYWPSTPVCLSTDEVRWTLEVRDENWTSHIYLLDQRWRAMMPAWSWRGGEYLQGFVATVVRATSSDCQRTRRDSVKPESKRNAAHAICEISSSVEGNSWHVVCVQIHIQRRHHDLRAPLAKKVFSFTTPLDIVGI